MGSCCVEGCDDTSEDTFYFEFPTSRYLRRKWLDVIPIQGRVRPGTVVCSRHFRGDDYENFRGKVRLKSKVVPSLLLEETTSISPSDTPQKSPEPPPKSPTIPPKSPTLPPKSPTQPPKSPTIPPKSPTAPSKLLDQCDSTTVSVPSPVDAEKMIDEIQNERERDKGTVGTEAKDITKVYKENGRLGDDDKILVKSPVLPDQKEDIEDMITHYQIKNKVPNPALLADLVPINDMVNSDIVNSDIMNSDIMNSDIMNSDLMLQSDEPIEIEDGNDTAPVFIEVPVDKDTNATEAESQDCLMLLESVQVDIDPTALLLNRGEDDDDFDLTGEPDEEESPFRRNDAISLLTSSDEDDVIIEEPDIDTVEVSDETDEDDMPLVKLLKTKKKQKRQKAILDKIILGKYDYDFYCMRCHYTTTSSADYNQHIYQHNKVLQVCQICDFTTASKNTYARHMRNHKIEKKFHCHLCDYKARHRMSLVYHLNKHDLNNVEAEKLSSVKCVKSVKKGKKDFKCRKCGFKSNMKSAAVAHVRLCKSTVKKFVCDNCDYTTKKRSDLRRHQLRKHWTAGKSDKDYVPKN